MNLVTPVPKLGARYLVRTHLPVHLLSELEGCPPFFSLSTALHLAQLSKRDAMRFKRLNPIQLTWSGITPSIVELPR